ncbi:peptidoglycan-binding domain-containing protein [Leisingera sp. ANG-M1]|uniref:peptidoglycan-binding domain-containing protein n=1 Tax=Leisingera sp. ANG-M1 TaxID=1577895 RepID=UPI00057C3E0A|nr:peptidoglycan-binding domain-containing protein [Leisingera sp. ANG-M1]
MARMAPARAKKLQSLLNEKVNPKPPLEVDGIIGPKTQAALKALQKKAGLKATGEVDSETAAVIARAEKTGAVEKEQPTRFFKQNGKWVGLTEREYQAQLKKIVMELERGPLREMRMAVSSLESLWDYFYDLNSEQWFVSFCIETTSGAEMPKRSEVAKARKAFEQCQAAVKSKNLAKFQAIYPKCEKRVNGTLDAMRAYRAKMIGGGENWVTGLKFTKTASFTFVAVMAAPVAASSLGTGVVASAVIGGGGVAMVESSATEVGKWGAGAKDWSVGGAISNVLIDTGAGAILGLIAKGGGGGKHMVEALAAKLLPRLAAQAGFKLLSKTALKKAVMFLITEGGKKALEGAVKDVAKAFKGDKKMTMDKFFDNVANNFLAGIALGPLGKVIEGFAKKAADHLSPKDKQRIWDLALKELSKQSKGQTFHISQIDKRTRELMEKAINDQLAKQLDNVLEVVYSSWKGPMSPQAFQKKVSELISMGKPAQAAAAAAAKAGKKTLKAA